MRVADEAAKSLGLVPFHQFTGDWFVRMQNNVIYDRDQTQVHALYALNEPYEVNNDKMYVGVGVHNSIDGTMGFGCGTFSFRHACANMVLAGMRGYEQSFDLRATIDYIYKKHTASLSVVSGNLQRAISKVMESAVNMLEAYKQMALRKVTEQLVEKLKKSPLPNKVLPDYLQVKETQTAFLTAKDYTEWTLYNDISANIWHNGRTDIRTKNTQFSQLHKVMPLIVRAMP